MMTQPCHIFVYIRHSLNVDNQSNECLMSCDSAKIQKSHDLIVVAFLAINIKLGTTRRPPKITIAANWSNLVFQFSSEMRKEQSRLLRRTPLLLNEGPGNQRQDPHQNRRQPFRNRPWRYQAGLPRKIRQNPRKLDCCK